MTHSAVQISSESLKLRHNFAIDRITRRRSFKMLPWHCSFAFASRSAVTREFFSAARTATYVLIPRVTAAIAARNTASISVRIPSSYRFFFNVDANDSICFNKTSAPSFTGSPFISTSFKNRPILSKTIEFSKPLKDGSGGIPELKSHYGLTALKYFYLWLFSEGLKSKVKRNCRIFHFLSFRAKIISGSFSSCPFLGRSLREISLDVLSLENHPIKSHFCAVQSKIVAGSCTSYPFRQRSLKKVSVLARSLENHRRKPDFSSPRSKIIAGSPDSRRLPRTSVGEVRRFALAAKNHWKTSRFLRFT
jgi:hypothetical protein